MTFARWVVAFVTAIFVDRLTRCQLAAAAVSTAVFAALSWVQIRWEWRLRSMQRRGRSTQIVEWSRLLREMEQEEQTRD